LMRAWDEHVVGGDAQLNLSEMDFFRVGLGYLSAVLRFTPQNALGSEGDVVRGINDDGRFAS
jgi:hypothetical protein